jgi:hypothetical protein
MVEVAGIWEVGWNAPFTESVQWEMMLREFGIEHLNMTPISGIAAPWGNKPWITEYPSIDDMLAHKQHLTPVFLDEKADATLEDFVHPEDALYVFGRASQRPTAPDNAVSVRIDTVKPGCLWAHQACALVLYDRYLKR